MIMEFPFIGMNSSNHAAAGSAGSLYSRQPVETALYVGVLGLAAVVGTVGNVVVILTVTVKHLLSRWYRTKTTGRGIGGGFIANLALSDLIVTAVVNPLAIAGL